MTVKKELAKPLVAIPQTLLYSCQEIQSKKLFIGHLSFHMKVVLVSSRYRPLYDVWWIFYCS